MTQAEENEKSKYKNRTELKNLFKNGSIPDETQFGAMIDSMINKLEDGFTKSQEAGMQISPIGDSKRLMSFYDSIEELDPSFYIEKGEAYMPGLNFGSADQADILFLSEKTGNVGIGTTDPYGNLQVNGFISSEGRMGSNITSVKPDAESITKTPISKQWFVPADGKWHAIATGLDNCNAFEVVARAGKKSKGKFAMMHAIAVAVYGPRGNIRRTNAHYGLFWNKIKLRWTGSTHNYNLEIRTNNNYGTAADNKTPVYIYYSITKLWNEHKFLPPEELYGTDDTGQNA